MVVMGAWGHKQYMYMRAMIIMSGVLVGFNVIPTGSSGSLYCEIVVRGKE